MLGYCENCLNRYKPQMCQRCSDNPKILNLLSYYTPYLEVCPIGKWRCSNDPGYIKYYFPKRFEEEFGNISLTEAVNHEKSKCVSCSWRGNKNNT